MKTSVTAPLPRAIASSRSANRSVMPSRARGASPSAWTARRLSGSDARTAPMTRNVAASPSIAYRMPAPPATRPPTAGPATNPIPRIDSTRPFARAISRSPASSGISANSAAPETATPTPSSTARGSISASEPAKASRQATTAWKTADQNADVPGENRQGGPEADQERGHAAAGPLVVRAQAEGDHRHPVADRRDCDRAGDDAQVATAGHGIDTTDRGRGPLYERVFPLYTGRTCPPTSSSSTAPGSTTSRTSRSGFRGTP